MGYMLVRVGAGGRRGGRTSWEMKQDTYLWTRGPGTPPEGPDERRGRCGRVAAVWVLVGVKEEVIPVKASETLQG